MAVCDEDLIGKVLEGNGAYMDLDRYRGFYKGECVGAPDVEKALSGFSSANMVGKESVSVAIAMGIAEKNNVMYIKKTPYIQIYKL